MAVVWRNPKLKSTKIAWEVLGKPLNMRKQPNNLASKVRRELDRENFSYNK